MAAVEAAVGQRRGSSAPCMTVVALGALGTLSAGRCAFAAGGPGAAGHFLSKRGGGHPGDEKSADGVADSFGDIEGSADVAPPAKATTSSALGLGALLGLAAAAPLARRRGAPLAGASKPQHRGAMSGNRFSAVARRAAEEPKNFEKFTSESMKALMLAHAEARSLSQKKVGTETLLIGILAEDSDGGATALREMGVSLSRARDALCEMLGVTPTNEVLALELPLTEGAQKVLKDAAEYARLENDSLVSTTHLLHATIKQTDDTGAKLLGFLLKVDTPEELIARMLPALAKHGRKNNQSAGSTKAPEPPRASPPKRKDEKVLRLTETLKYSQDLTQLALDGKLEPLIGREPQLERTIRILGRRSKNNPVFVGEPGVGKTSIAHGLAHRIAHGKVPPSLIGKKVLQLDLALVLSGTRYRGDFEERLRAIVQEVTDSDRQVILVIDEVHTLVGAGASGDEKGSGMDAANLLKPALARGQMQCMGATTLDEYRKYIEKDPALERRFQPVIVPEPTQEEAEQIISGLAFKYEQHHQLRYTPEALKAAVKLASQYIADRFLPDKAIDVMDEAGSKVRQRVFQQLATTAENQALLEELDGLKLQKKEAVAAELYEEAHSLKQRQAAVEEKLETLKAGGDSGSAESTKHEIVEEVRAIKAQMQDAIAEERYEDAAGLKDKEVEILARFPTAAGDEADSLAELVNVQVTEEDVASVVAGWTGIAVEQVSSSESAKLMQLESLLHKSVIGQHEAVHAVSRSLRRARVGLRNPNRPIASFMFSGPTGVGKTELCKTLSESFFGSQDAMVRLDMSEYMEKHTVSKLIGAPPGYAGYDEGGVLTEAVRRKPYSLILFDEVEKAHPDVFNLLLQMLDDGRLTDSKGRVISFTNSLIVLTSNLGSRSVQKGAAGGAGLGFGTVDSAEEASYDAVKELVHEEMKTFFRPEFLNRLDETVVFRPLTLEDVTSIAEIELRRVIGRLVEQDLEVSLTDGFKAHVVERGFDPAYGARPLRRAIASLLEDKLAEYLLRMQSEEEEEEDAPRERRSVQVDINKRGDVEVRELTRKVLASP